MTKMCYFLKFTDTTLIFATIVNIGINKVIMLFYIYMRTKNNSVHLTSKFIHIYPHFYGFFLCYLLSILPHVYDHSKIKSTETIKTVHLIPFIIIFDLRQCQYLVKLQGNLFRAQLFAVMLVK